MSVIDDASQKISNKNVSFEKTASDSIEEIDNSPTQADKPLKGKGNRVLTPARVENLRLAREKAASLREQIKQQTKDDPIEKKHNKKLTKLEQKLFDLCDAKNKTSQHIKQDDIMDKGQNTIDTIEDEKDDEEEKPSENPRTKSVNKLDQKSNVHRAEQRRDEPTQSNTLSEKQTEPVQDVEVVKKKTGIQKIGQFYYL